MKVIIIGAGITGPVLAMLLKKKGFEPVVYERHDSVPSGGLAVSLSPQTFKVLNILGLAEEALTLGTQTERILHLSETTGEVLQNTLIRDRIVSQTGWPMAKVLRAKYCRFLVQKAQERGVPIHWGKKFVGLEQGDEEDGWVRAKFEDGSTDEGGLLVGCDGLHSRVRDELFGPTPAEYSGIVAIGGFTPYTPSLHPPSQTEDPYGLTTTTSIWGKGCVFSSQPTADGKYFWAVQMPDDEAVWVEDWRTAGREELKELLPRLPVAEWTAGGAGEMIRGGVDVVKFGLFTRPIPQVWHKGRAVLIGDAAHPTTPFLGQGANQSMEDVYHLVRSLVRHSPLTATSLDAALSEYTAIRLPIVTLAVREASVEGKYRMARSEQEVKERDEQQKKGMEGRTGKVLMELLKGPFEGESEI